MSDAKLKKLSFEEMFRSTSMFYKDEELEQKIKAEIEKETQIIMKELITIDSKETLCRYILDNKDSLQRLTSLCGISVERFKRVVSLLRKNTGSLFRTEWGLGSIQKAMIENAIFREKILSLFWNGCHDPEFIQQIPNFYLEDLSFNGGVINKIKDEWLVKKLVKQGIEGKYSNAVGDSILSKIEDEIQGVCATYCLDYQRDVRVPFLDRNVSFILENPENPKIIFDVSYCVTTSSSQGAKKESARKTRDIKSQRDFIYINFLDGAGWVARQSDMEEIHRCSDYVLNFANLGAFEDIIKFYEKRIKG